MGEDETVRVEGVDVVAAHQPLQGLLGRAQAEVGADEDEEGAEALIQLAVEALGLD